MADIKLAVVTPEKEALSTECDEVIAPGVNGEIGLLPGHIPLITALRPGVLTVVAGHKTHYFAVGSGYAEVEGNSVSVMTETCEAADSVDLERAKQSLRQSEEVLGKTGPDDAGNAAAHHRLARARARIDATARIR